MTSLPDISVIIVNWNTQQLLRDSSEFRFRRANRITARSVRDR